MGPLIRHLTIDLINSIRHIKQHLTPASRQSRNIIGDVISSLTGLATQKQLEQNLQKGEGETDLNLLHIADLAQNQDSIHQKIKHMENELNVMLELNAEKAEAYILVTKVQQLNTYALQLILVTMEYKNMWSEIAFSIANGNTNHHTIPLQAILDARKTFHKYYGSKNQDTRFGITQADHLLHIATLAQSSVEYLSYATKDNTQILTQINLPISQHGYSFHTIPYPTEPNKWLIVNVARTQGLIISHTDRINMQIYHDTAFLMKRIVRINTFQVACFLDLQRNCHQIDLQALDDNHFLYYGDEAHELNINCGQQPTLIRLQKHHILHLPYQCSAYSETYTIPQYLNDGGHTYTPATPPNTDNNQLLQASFDNLLKQFNHPVGIIKIKPRQGQLLKSDFQGPMSHLYQRLHERLQSRIQHQQQIQTATSSTIWPIYPVAAVIAITAITGVVLLIYIARYATLPNQ